jgi:hypothetical protein
MIPNRSVILFNEGPHAELAKHLAWSGNDVLGLVPVRARFFGTDALRITPRQELYSTEQLPPSI